jgi:hypothetical protein
MPIRQARKPEHHLLVDELTVLLHQYETIEAKPERVIRNRLYAGSDYRTCASSAGVPCACGTASDASSEPRGRVEYAAPPDAIAPPQQVQNQSCAREERHDQAVRATRVAVRRTT